MSGWVTLWGAEREVHEVIVHTLIQAIALDIGSGSEGAQNVEKSRYEIGFMGKFGKGLGVAGGK